MTMFERLPANALLPMELPSMSSSEASHAKTCRLRADLLASKTAQEAGCGQKSSDWLAKYDPATSLWKTSQTCLEAHLTGGGDGLAEFSETWPNAGMMRNGRTYPLQPWALPIAESVSGLFPTPLKNEAGKSEHTLGLVLAGKSQMTLDRYVRLWPTPNAGMKKHSTKPAYWANRVDKGRQHDLQMAIYQQTGSGSLNPEWVEWLMGFPTGHTELPPSETP